MAPTHITLSSKGVSWMIIYDWYSFNLISSIDLLSNLFCKIITVTKTIFLFSVYALWTNILLTN